MEKGVGSVLPPVPNRVRTVGPVLGVNEWLPSCTVRTPETVGLENSPDTLSQVLGGGPFTFSRENQATPQPRIVKHLSTPQQEQDVVALFHELQGAGVLRGFRFFGTNQSERYDSLFFMEYASEEDVLFQSATQRLGVTRSYELPYTTEPKVLEYKYSFDSLIDDFDKEEKFVKQIDLVVCWTAGSRYKSKFYLHPLLVGDEGSSRQMFGATHQAFATGAQGSPAFEVLVLEDLLNWIQDEAGEEARQKRTYRDA